MSETSSAEPKKDKEIEDVCKYIMVMNGMDFNTKEGSLFWRPELFTRDRQSNLGNKLYTTETFVSDFVEFIWDPLSTSQTTSLITHCTVILEELSTCGNEVSKGKQVIISRVTNFLIYL